MTDLSALIKTFENNSYFFTFPELKDLNACLSSLSKNIPISQSRTNQKSAIFWYLL